MVTDPRAGRRLLLVSLADLGRDAAIAAIAQLRPDGVALFGCGGKADLQAADVALAVIEAETGLAAGSLSLLAILGASPAVFLGQASLAGATPRLTGLVLDEEGLCEALGLAPGTDRAASAPVVLARGALVLLAAEAGVPAFCLLPALETEATALHRLRATALADGFRDVAVTGRAQWEALADTTAEAAQPLGRSSSKTSPASA